MLFPLHHIGVKAKWHTRRAGLAVIGGGLLAIGGAFLLAAVWLLLATEFSALLANIVLAVLFMGAGLIVISRRNSEPEPKIPSLSQRLRADAAAGRQVPIGQEFPALMEAFLFGVATYSRVRNTKRR